MTHELLYGIASIFILGTLSQMLAWKLKVPSILLLLIFGVCSGPAVLGYLDPDTLFGPILFPLVSISVAIILFEGGLSLRLSDLPGVRGVIFSLISIGMLTTWIVAAAGAYYVLELDFAISILLGSILTVSGPTVVMPLLRHIRPKPPAGEVLKWEGILIDPVGAIAAVLVFEAIVADRFHEATEIFFSGVLHTMFIGGILGLMTGLILAYVFRKHLLPEHLLNSFSLMLVIGSYVLSDMFLEESGLLTVTLAGIVLTNSKGVDIRKIIEFKENLTVLLISSLFIVLAARITPEQLGSLDPLRSVVFLGILFFVARPLAVGASTFNSRLSFRQRLLISWMAPRGIVAAAVASVFALQLEKAGVPDADTLVPYTFLVISGSVVVYGLTSRFLATSMGVAQETPQGILFVGANDLSRSIALALKAEGYTVYLVDANQRNILLAKLDGLPARQGNILSEELVDKLDLQGIGKLFALTPNHEANSLASVKFSEFFGSRKVYQLPEVSHDKIRGEDAQSKHLRGRILFSETSNYYDLIERLNLGDVVKATPLTEEFNFDNFKEMYEDFVTLLIIKSDGTLVVNTIEDPITPVPGDTIISLVADDSAKI